MTDCKLFPTFTLRDDWGREIQFYAKNRKYYRRNLDGAPWYTGEPMEGEVSLATFALALLRAHEREEEHDRPHLRGRNTGDRQDRPWDSETS